MNPYLNLPTPPMSGSEGSQSPQNYNYNNASNYIAQFDPYAMQTISLDDPESPTPYLKIIEQPVDRFRFRYRSEMQGTHGCLSGLNSDKTRRQTFPTVQLCNYTGGDVIIRCSLYEFNTNKLATDLQPHAHRLVQKNGNQEVVDPHDKTVSANQQYTAVFQNLGIIHTAKKFIVEELIKKKRNLKKESIIREEHICRELKVGEDTQIRSEATQHSKEINLNTVCLRFDAFTRAAGGHLEYLCEPVFSHAINNLKSALTGDLRITRMDRCTSPICGGKEVFLLVEKVTKKNIKVRFFEVNEETDQEVWVQEASFNDGDVHHQYAIVIKTPKYRLDAIDTDKKVYIELFRPSDGSRSEPLEFTYCPDRTARRKRMRCDYNSSSSLSLSSSEFPITINGLPEIPDTLLSSADLNRMANEINSEDFENLFSDPTLALTFTEASDIPMITTDAPQFQTSVTKEDIQNVLMRTWDEINSIAKTNAPKQRIMEMLKSCFRERINSEGNNALHLTYNKDLSNLDSIKRIQRVLLDLITSCNEHKLLNICNYHCETIMHLAIENEIHAIKDLVDITDLTIRNKRGNTPLHLAINKQFGYKYLLEAVNVRSFIDLANHDGLTALHIATKMNNLPAVRALCEAKCDVNAFCKKDGDTALHIAVKTENKDIISYLLNNTNIDIHAKNFRDLTCQLLSLILEKYEISKIIDLKLKEIGSYEECEIKAESDSEDEEDMDIDESEPDIKELYKMATKFTPECLDMLARKLDASNRWKKLPELLDMSQFLVTDLFKDCKSPTKIFLEVALANGISIYQIRHCLESLKHNDCVNFLDAMVKKL